jgi:hypothetical protein
MAKSRRDRAARRQHRAPEFVALIAPVIHSPVQEIDQLGGAFDQMRDAVRRFLRINRRLATEDDLEALQPWLLDKMVDIAGARAGVLYLVDAADDALRATAMDTSGGRATAVGGLPVLAQDALPRLLADARATMRPVGGHLSGDDLRTLGLEPEFAAFGTLALPLQDRREQLLGMLLLFKDGEIDEAAASFIAALAASAATSLETQELLRGQKALMEASIRMVAGAIDAQSPYTGGHCERVPELTFMLAEAPRARRRTDRMPASTSMPRSGRPCTSRAWLHDCGKVTTPEYVVDKATKLETIYDRIHEIRTRFEVLKRDADVEATGVPVAAGGDRGIAAAGARDALQATLDEEFAFVAECNLSAANGWRRSKLARLRDAIAQRRWLRTLDDRLGLSAREELAGASRHRRCRCLPRSPCWPTSPSPPHRPAGTRTDLAEDNRWGFKASGCRSCSTTAGNVAQPAIGRGTLTAEERYKINEHMVQTIVMLGGCPSRATCARCRRSPAATTSGWTAPATPSCWRATDEHSAGAHHGDRRHLRGPDRQRSPLQAGQDPVRGVVDHGEDAPGPAHRPGVVRAVPAQRRAPRLRAALHARRAGRRGPHRGLPLTRGVVNRPPRRGGYDPPLP